jgi:hypothetical protein
MTGTRLQLDKRQRLTRWTILATTVAMAVIVAVLFGSVGR